MVWTSAYILVTIHGLTRQNVVEGVRGVDCLVVCPGPIPVSENGCNQTAGISQVFPIMLLVGDTSGVVANPARMDRGCWLIVSRWMWRVFSQDGGPATCS